MCGRGVHSYRAFVQIVVIPFFIVEIDKGDPQKDTEQYDGVKSYMDTKDELKSKISQIFYPNIHYGKLLSQ